MLVYAGSDAFKGLVVDFASKRVDYSRRGLAEKCAIEFLRSFERIYVLEEVSC